MIIKNKEVGEFWFMENEIITLLNGKMTSNLSLSDITKFIGRDKEEIETTIKFLLEEGTIYLDKKGRYRRC